MMLAALGLPGCDLIHDDDMDCQLYTEEGVPYAYVSIALSTAMSPSTRANPEGGEDGDGREPGQSNENEVNDITLFFYDVEDALDGVNSAAATPIPVIRQYFSKNKINYENGQTYATTEAVPVEQLLVSHNYHVLAVVNGGEDFGKDITTLGELQEATVKDIYTVGTDGSYSNFLMASADDEDSPLYIRPNNSEANPATTRIDVERVTARVDYRALGTGGVATEGNLYEIDGVGTAKITGAMLVNTLNETANSWLLKRVTEAGQGIGTAFTWLGDETSAIDNGAATNYVIAPLTTTLTADNAATYFTTENYFPSFDYENANDWEKLLIKGTEVTDPDTHETWLRIGYPKENTAEKANTHYTTGVVFQADFLPTDYKDDATFFEWNGTIYPTVEKAMEAFDQDGWDRIDEQDQWASVNTWADLRTHIISGLRTGDPAGYKKFLEEKAKGQEGTTNITTEDKAALRWSNYMETYCHYKLVNNEVTVDIDDKIGSTRSALAPFGLATYYEGICYYTYWIKHANDQIPENDMPNAGGGVMEYGIVRNNVYKLNVTSITQLGNDIPGDRTLQINVSVRNWEMIEGEDEIELKPTESNE